MTPKIAAVTAGGPISVFHAAFYSMHDTLEEIAPGKYELFGAVGGLKGLEAGELMPIRKEHIRPDRAGSMIGSDRHISDSSKIKQIIQEKNVHAVIMMGGDNHLKEAYKLFKDQKIKVVGYPKTMDGDLSTPITLGWESAVTVGAEAVRMHHHTAMTCERVFFVGLFGRDTDWITAGVTAYGGGDFGLPCEKEYTWSEVLEKIKAALEYNKANFGKAFAVIPYSEGARIEGAQPPPEGHRSFDEHKLPKLQPEWLGLELVRLCKDAKIPASFQTHTYSMRDYPPTETDKKLSAMAGRKCMEMVLNGDFGKVAVFKADADFYATDMAELEPTAEQRKVSDTDYFNYETLQTNESFIRDYGNLFRPSLGEPPAKKDLVYPSMLEKF
ncbi:MAG: hypothetical protein GX130_05260 [Candidatus Hydrogenedens sp.]|jgi:6-phosphofructokinase 1|nr:hypothetical protein [Candidatus Hydrogenedens sp.]